MQQDFQSRLNEFNYELCIPHKSFTALIQQSIIQERQNKKHNYFLDQIIQIGKSAKRNVLINGEILPILIVLKTKEEFKSLTPHQKLEDLYQNLQFKISYKKQDEILQTYCSFLENGTYVSNILQYVIDRVEIDYEKQQIIFCKIIKLDLGYKNLNLDLILNVTLEYEDQSLNQWQIKTNQQQLFRDILSLNLGGELRGKQMIDLSEPVKVQSALNLTQSYDNSNSDIIFISFQIWTNSEFFQIDQSVMEKLQELQEQMKISKEQLSLRILDIDFILNQSELQLQFQDGSTRVINQQETHNLRLKKIFFNYTEIKPNELYEGFLQLEVDSAAILKSQNLSSDLCKNAILIAQTPLQLTWKFQNEQHSTVNQFQVQWKYENTTDLSAKVGEITRYKQDGNEYLAMKVQIRNNLLHKQDLVLKNQQEVFGYRFSQANQSNELMQVIAVFLQTITPLGILEPNQTIETIIRMRLINKGILYLPKLNFYDKIQNKEKHAMINFLHSYEN